MSDPHHNPNMQQDEAWLAEQLQATPEPSRAVLDSVRQAVQYELDADVLRRAHHPAPNRIVMGRVRASVRDELERCDPHRWRAVRGRIFGALAAAASIALAVGVVRFVVPAGITPSGPSKAASNGTLVSNQDDDKALKSERIEQAVADMQLAFETALDKPDDALSTLAEEVDQLESIVSGGSDLAPAESLLFFGEPTEPPPTSAPSMIST